MEEIEYKLSRDNPVVILNAINKLVDAVQKAHLSDKSPQLNELPELKLLKKKCEDGNLLVSHTACQGIVTLVESGILKVVPTLCEFIAALPSVKNYNGIINSISGMLMVELRSRLLNDNQYQCQFTLQSPLHPFVTLLKHDKNIWFDVLNQMEIISNHHCQEISNNSAKLLYPVFLYILCDPTYSLPPDCRQRTWSLLLHQSALSPDARELLLHVLSWLQVHSEEALLSTSCMYFKLALSAVESKNNPLCMAIAPSLASSAHSLMHSGHDPRPCLAILAQLLQLGQEANSCILMLLADTIESCPPIYLKDFLDVCLLIVESGTHNVMSAQVLICAILQWLISPSYLAEEALHLASKILALIETRQTTDKSSKSSISNLCTNEWFHHLRYTDHRIDSMTKLCNLSETWQENPGIIQNGHWFERVKGAPLKTTKHFRLFLSALFLHNFGQENVKLTSFKVLLELVGKSNELCCRLLPVILYMLTQEKDPTMQIELLRGLTVMASQKENIAIVLSTFESLKREANLRYLTIDLYLRLWRIEGRCYPYLQAVLLDKSKADGRENMKLETAKAAAIKEICLTRPEQYGTELVSLLSQMLNQCVDESHSLAASLALQGIAALCKVDIVDITTTWKVLAPKLIREKRTNVVVSTCEFLGVVPSVYCSGAEYDKLVAESVSRLWNYVSCSKSVSIITTALKALAEFNLDHLSLKTLPENYRRKLSLPKEYSKTPVDAARKPEDVLPYIPGECWVQLLQNVHSETLDTAGNLLIRWIDTELKGYRSVHSAVKTEPINCSHLPHRSVYRAVADYLRITSQKPIESSNKAVVMQSLRILSQSYSKPLPPHNWNFLQEFLTQGKEFRKYCLILGSKQAIVSGSARRLIEGYITTFTPSSQMEEEIFELFASLGDLCKGVPPNILRPLLERSLTVALEEDKERGCESRMLDEILLYIKLALQKEDIHEANRTLLAMQVEGLMEKLPSDHHAFPTFVSCAVELPMTHLERMTSPSLWWDVTDEKLSCASSIRSALACRGDTELPLVWLNECIDATASRKQQHCALLRHIASVMVCCRGHKANWPWILELLGKIQSVISSKPHSDYHQTIEFLCNIFMLTVIVLSGHDCFTSGDDTVATSVETRLLLFPQALASLVETQTEDESPQVMEWLHHMQSCNSVSSSYNAAFRKGLVALRHKPYFQKSITARRFIEK